MLFSKLSTFFFAVIVVGIIAMMMPVLASEPYQYPPQAVCSVPVSSNPSLPYFYCGALPTAPTPGPLPTRPPTPTPMPSASASASPTPFPSPSASATPIPITTAPPTLDETWLTYQINSIWGNNTVHTNWLTQLVDLTGNAGTNSALLTTNMLFGNFDVTFQNVKTISQTATTPASYDRAWVLWHYISLTKSYAFYMTTTGWKLVKVGTGTNNQTTLTSGTSPTFALGTTHTVRVTQSANFITVYVDGTSLTTYTDATSPYLNGAFGIYTSNAYSTFGNVFAPTSSFSLHRPSFAKTIMTSKTVTAYPICAYTNGIHTIDRPFFCNNAPIVSPTQAPKLICSTPSVVTHDVKLLYFCPSTYPIPSPMPH